MGIKAGPKIVKDGLLFSIDAAVPRSYSGTGLTVNGLTGGIGATLVNGVGFGITNGGYFIFDGTNDYISVSSSPTTFSYNRSSFTVGGWTYMTSLPTNFYGVILSKWNTGAGNDNEFILNTESGNVFIFGLDYDDGLNPDSATNDFITSTTTIVANTWYYVAASFDNGSIKLYVNGVLESSATSVNTSVKTNTNSSLDIGRFGTTYYSFGRRGLVHLYNRALTAQEVLQNYNATKGRYR